MVYKKFFGLYNDSDSPIYLLHPFTKLFFTICFVIAAGMAKNPLVLFAAALILIICSSAAEIYPDRLIKLLRPFRFLLIFTFVVQLFITPQGGWHSPDSASLINSIYFSARMALIIGFSSIFAITTSTMDMVRVFYVLFQPLRIVRISPADAALCMLIALRFIPLLFTEGEKIMDSQRLKGIVPEKGEKGGRVKAVKGAVSLVVPLFVRTFHYASQIAVTLQYRCQSTAFLKMRKPSTADYLLTASFIVVAACLVIVDKHMV